MTIKQILREVVKQLKKYKIRNPHLEVEILLSHVLKKPREFVLTYPEKKLTKLQAMFLKLLIAKRAKNEPLAYILGHKEFYGLDFKVNPCALIPRPETELMVDEALYLSRSSSRHTIFIDAGTGSGCIIVTLAKLLDKNELNSKAGEKPLNNRGSESRIGASELNSFLAVDISKAALRLARQNAKFHGVNKKIEFIHGNLLNPIFKNQKLVPCRDMGIKIEKHNLVILANLPYLTPAQIKKSYSIQYEPKLALSAGKDGLKYYRQLLKQIKQLVKLASFVRLGSLTRDGHIFAMIEINPSQTVKIKKIIQNNLPEAKIQIKKDLRGLNRLIIISHNA